MGIKMSAYCSSLPQKSSPIHLRSRQSLFLKIIQIYIKFLKIIEIYKISQL